ncbi:MAG: pitrilysin family protein [Cyanobacteria bacterium P01_G01_bin.54]
MQFSPAFAETLADSVRQTRLRNGLTIIHHPLPTTPAVVVDVWVKAGTRAEPDDWHGMAHFLEHMIFKGSAAIAPGEFDALIEHQGGMTNAATSHDYAHFFIAVATEHLPMVLPAFADILLNAALPDTEFERERAVVIEEIYGCQDDPDWLGFQALSESIYGPSPYGRSILGTEEQVRQRSPHQMRCFHRTHYQPENMTVAIVGDIDQERAIALVSEAFGTFPVRSECPPTTIQAIPTLQTIQRTTLRLPRLEQARLTLAWTAPGIDQLDQAIALDILAVALGGGRSSRLVQQLREEQQWVWDISCEFSLQQNSSLFTVNAWLAIEHLDRVEAAIIQQLEQVQRQGLTPDELSRTQRLLTNEYAFSTETPAQLAGLYGYYQTIAEATLATEYPQRIQATTAQQVQAVAQTHLILDQYVATTLLPA